MSFLQGTNGQFALAGIGGVGSIISSIGQYQSGQAQKKAYDYNAAVTLQDMQQKEQTSEAKFSTLIGKQAAGYARAGVDIASGSPLLMMAHAASENAIEQTRENQAGTEEAALQQYYGKIAAWQGTTGAIGSFLSGMSSMALKMASIPIPSPSQSGGTVGVDSDMGSATYG